MNKTMLVIFALLVIPSVSLAVSMTPTSYDTPNGYTGAYNYWDDKYNGSGSNTTDGAFLSGGLGDLTDGIIASDNWFVTEPPPGAGPYVGWADINPTIVFHFASAVNFQSVGIYFDDADGSGVSSPSGVRINGIYYSVTDPIGSAPFLATFNVTGLAPTDALSIELVRNNQWVFASEFTFDGSVNPSPVPEPSLMVLLGISVLSLAGLKRWWKN